MAVNYRYGGVCSFGWYGLEIITKARKIDYEDKTMYCSRCHKRVSGNGEFCPMCPSPTKSSKYEAVVACLGILGVSIGVYLFGGFLDGEVRIVSLVCFLVTGGLVYVFAKKLKQDRLRLLQEATRLRAVEYIGGTIIHQSGLPFPSGVKMQFAMSEDKLLFGAGNQEISLERSKIISVDVVSGNDAQMYAMQAQNNAMSGAIAGGVAIGGLAGAALGSALARSSTPQASKYLAITYKSDDEIKHLIFDNNIVGLPFNVVLSDLKYNIIRTEEKIEL